MSDQRSTMSDEGWDEPSIQIDEPPKPRTSFLRDIDEL
jgi:hypothetical protein